MDTASNVTCHHAFSIVFFFFFFWGGGGGGGGAAQHEYNDLISGSSWKLPKPGYKTARGAIEASLLFKVMLTAKTIYIHIFISNNLYFFSGQNKKNDKRNWLDSWLTRG